MLGGRERFQCTKCGKVFFFWVPIEKVKPKVKCSFCFTEFFPRGEPAAAAAAPPAPPAPATVVTAAAPPPSELPN